MFRREDVLKVKSKLLQRAYDVRTRDEVRDLYRDWAESYDRDMVNHLDYVGPENVARLLDGHISDRQTAVLDVGCGTGLVGKHLAALGYTTIDGLDLSAEMLEVAGQKGVYRDLHQGDLLARLPLEDNSYGAAVSAGTFTEGHVGPDALDEVIRVVAPGGLVCISVNNRIYDAQDYDAALDGLSDRNVCDVVENTTMPYVRAEDIDARAITLRVA